MSSADAGCARRRGHAQGGFTLIEVAVVTGLVALMSFMLDWAVRSTQSADQQLETVGRAALHGQRLTNRVAMMVAASRHIYSGDAVGDGYVAACDLARFPPAPGARLPIIDELNDLDVDGPDASYTGNMLLLLRETAASPCVADDDTGELRLIDTYRLTLIYPHVTDREVLEGEGLARDVVVWQSEAFPSLQQILEVDGKDERKSVIKDLVERYGYDHAWDPRLPIETAFFELKGKGELEDEPTLGIEIREDTHLSLGPQLVFAGLQLARSDESRALRRRVMTADEEGGWQPHGMEFKIAGTSSARKAWIHTVVEAGFQYGRKRSVQACSTIVDARDY